MPVFLITPVQIVSPAGNSPAASRPWPVPIRLATLDHTGPVFLSAVEDLTGVCYDVDYAAQDDKKTKWHYVHEVENSEYFHILNMWQNS